MDTRSLNKNMFDRLASLQFIDQKENLFITGASGVGKSHLSQALGQQACQIGYSIIYQVTARLFNKMKLAKIDVYLHQGIQQVCLDQITLVRRFWLAINGQQSQRNIARYYRRSPYQSCHNYLLTDTCRHGMTS